ncbi:MAG: Type 1 glutamine amidotransferase-like domain-containing protein [Egibacteraceae bacterium]
MIFLQGGAEFTGPCRVLDAPMVERATGGKVVVLPAAAAPGREYDVAGANGVRHLTGLGASDVTVAPDPRNDEVAAVTAVQGARLLVLPGGSPRRLRQALHRTALGAALRSVLDQGAEVMGASAGAMVLCEWMVLPERAQPRVVAGLGLVANTLVVPHWRRGLQGWAHLAPAGVIVLGLPECAGVLVGGKTDVAGPRITPVGDPPPWIQTDGRWQLLRA